MSWQGGGVVDMEPWRRIHGRERVEGAARDGAWNGSSRTTTPLGLARFQRCGRNIVADSKTPDGNRVHRGREHRPGKKAWRVMSEFERAGGGETTAVVNRRSPKDRRFAMDRRKAKDEGYKAPERRQGERREKVERRRMIDPTTCERDYTNDEIEFMKAMDEYKRKSGRMFPTWSEVLEVVRALGYERPATAN